MGDIIKGPTLIAGGGLTGISTAMHLQTPYILAERESSLGGLARTRERSGYRFDVTGHWLHLRDPEIQALVLDLMGDDLEVVQRVARVFTNGVLTRYPFQGNLHGLPPRVVHECLYGVIEARMKRDAEEPRNFEQYILHHFGEGIAKHFMIPYNAKLWGVHPREITSAWCSRFVPVPDLEQIVAGAVGAAPPELGYNVEFRYPREGGIETFTRALISRLDPGAVRCGAELEVVDPRARTATVDGEKISYGALVSTIPLPELIERIVDPPEEVARAARSLRITPVQYLDVASRRTPPADYHWVYVPEERFPFYRVGVFSNAMPSMAPAGAASLYVELATREPITDMDALLADVAPALVEIQALNSVDDLLFADLHEIPQAYVVFDDSYEASLATIFPYLEEHRIFSRGRYGSWIYNSMEDSLLSGRAVAATIDGPGGGQRR